jgi:integrase/recombinase XerC
VKIPEAIPQYFAESPHLRSSHTKRNYNQRLRLLAMDIPKHLGSYSELDLIAWVQGTGALAPNTIQFRMKVVKSFFGWAAYRGLIKTDPSANLNRVIRVGSKTVRQHNWLTRSQVRELLERTPTDVLGNRDRILLSLGFLTGLRVHEICNLRWSDIDLTNRRLKGIGKGQKPFTVGLSAQLTETLEKWAVRTEESADHDLEDLPVLPSAHRQWESEVGGWGEIIMRWGQGLGPAGAWYVVNDAGKRIGVDTLAPHDMRRTLAGILDADGVPITEIRDVLRHSSVATTERYLQSSPHRAVGRLQGFEL